MQVDKTEISKIVEEVVKRIADGAPASNGRPAHGLFANVDDAVAEAAQAQKALAKISIEQRKRIIAAMRETALANATLLAEMAVAETGYGRVEDKIAKKTVAALKTPGVEDLSTQAWSGDHGLTIVEQAPFGVIASITPSTNPAATIINNSISMVSAGNAVVFNPHPAAQRVSYQAMAFLNEAIEKAGGPKRLLVGVADPTIEIGNQLMKHKGVKLVVVTGGPAVVNVAMQSGKRAICAGPGNPPVVVDETADIPKAARDIVYGASFDNNVMCTAEKEVFAVERIFTDLKNHMKLSGGYELTYRQVEELMPYIFKETREGKVTVNRDLVGKSAQVIAKRIGLDLPSEVRLLFAEVEPDHPLVRYEQLMPVLPVCRVKDVTEAMDWAVKSEHGFSHTAAMHSRNIAHLSEMAHRINTAIFVKNSFTMAGLGYNGEGFTSWTIAGKTGEGCTSARTFTWPRRCALIDYFRII